MSYVKKLKGNKTFHECLMLQVGATGIHQPNHRRYDCEVPLCSQVWRSVKHVPINFLVSYHEIGYVRKLGTLMLYIVKYVFVLERNLVFGIIISVSINLLRTDIIRTSHKNVM